MVERQQLTPQIIYLLADHLDAVLAATEDIIAYRGECTNSAELLRLELVAITHVLQARQRVREAHFSDLRLADQGNLFLAGTAALEVETKFRNDPQVSGGNDYLIGRAIPIGLLADLAANMLDTLEYCFVLYPGDDTEANIGPAVSYGSIGIAA